MIDTQLDFAVFFVCVEKANFCQLNYIKIIVFFARSQTTFTILFSISSSSSYWPFILSPVLLPIENHLKEINLDKFYEFISLLHFNDLKSTDIVRSFHSSSIPWHVVPFNSLAVASDQPSTDILGNWTVFNIFIRFKNTITKARPNWRFDSFSCWHRERRIKGPLRTSMHFRPPKYLAIYYSNLFDQILKF